MQYSSGAVLALFICSASMAGAEPRDNVLSITTHGSGNTLTVLQTEASGNSAHVILSGVRNGGSANDEWHSPTDLGANGALRPGTLQQHGIGLHAEIALSGSENLFAGSQAGTAHSLEGTVSGQNNQAAVMQAGTGQTAVFHQSGARNSLSIRQGL